MTPRLHSLPPTLGGRVPEAQYRKWLQRKAQALVKRDRKRGNARATVSRYKDEIHKTIVRDGPFDWYTGEELDWRLISKSSNEEAQKTTRNVKRKFARLPIVDHENDGQGEPHFRICGWAVNDAKNDLSLDEFLRLCEMVLAHCDRGRVKKAPIGSAPRIRLQDNSDDKTMCRSRSWVVAALALLLLSSTRVASAQGFTPGCPLPFGSLAEHHPIDDSCPKMRGDVPDPPIEPNDAAHALQNTVKNNLCATGTPVSVTFFTFKQLQKKLDQKIPAALNWGRGNLPEVRTGLKNVHTTSDGDTIGEGSVVQLSAWVLKSKTGGKESVNCQVSGKKADNDLHIVLVKTSAHDAPECESVTAETIPHLRPESFDGSEILRSIDHPLRMTGQLFYDASHRPCAGTPPHAAQSTPARVSSWEIHPVYRIDVCKFKSLQNCKADNDSVWTRIDQWVPED